MTVALMICDYASRQVIVSVFPYLKSAWVLSDRQLGMLSSIVSITVALAGIPVALIADRTGRVRSVVLMAVIWSVATISCMFANRYPQMLAARAAVGLGEAGYGSIGAALIASHFPADYAPPYWPPSFQPLRLAQSSVCFSAVRSPFAGDGSLRSAAWACRAC